MANKKSGKHGRGVKAIEPSAVPNPVMKHQSKKKGGNLKKMASKKCM